MNTETETKTTLNDILSSKALAKLEEVITEEGSPSLSPKSTAKIIRVILKENWKLHKFSVRSDRYGLSVSWEDGPTTDQVKELTEVFGGRIFDPMTDGTHYEYVPFEKSNGEVVEVCFFGFSPTLYRSIGDWTEQALKRKLEKIVGKEYDGNTHYPYGFVDGKILPFASGDYTARGYELFSGLFESLDLYSSGINQLK